MPGLQRNDAVALGMAPVFPEGAVEIGDGEYQAVRIGEPVLLRYTLHGERMQITRRRGQLHQLVPAPCVTVQARRDAFHVLHQ